MKLPLKIALGLALLPMAACRPDEPKTATVHPDQITQVSVINALMLGQYDGSISVGEMLMYGDFGVGTFNRLDGEMIVLDGKTYQARADGTVVEVGKVTGTPFAVVTPFEADGKLDVHNVSSLSELDAFMAKVLRRPNRFFAIRVDGRFSSITLRSVPLQQHPYRPLGEVAKDQSVWTRRDVVGTLVGIRSPAWTTGLNVPGDHWHFLSDDRKIGGHVLDCKIGNGHIQYDECRDWLVLSDSTLGSFAGDLGKDQSGDLERVERSRGPATPREPGGGPSEHADERRDQGKAPAPRPDPGPR